MKSKRPPILLIVIIALAVVGYFLFEGRSFDLPEGETIPLSNESMPTEEMTQNNTDTRVAGFVGNETQSTREVLVTDDVKHSIPIEDIRQGCFGRDCIPSVDDPNFVSIKDADELFEDADEDFNDVIGIGLAFDGEERFYPFNMLVTREIVNDTVAGQPLAVTYCPLCGTGIVFNREFNGKVFEFGVSGLLWQSNLLMYNREENEDNISLWSQVLGEAVLGELTGTKLAIVPSNIVRYSDWRKDHPKSSVLDTGRIGDPYRGNYYGVARGFNPDFDEANSPILPTAYVFGVNIGDAFKAYPDTALSDGTTNDSFAGQAIVIEKDGGEISISANGEELPIVTSFWFSWVAAHPETELYQN